MKFSLTCRGLNPCHDKYMNTCFLSMRAWALAALMGLPLLAESVPPDLCEVSLPKDAVVLGLDFDESVELSEVEASKMVLNGDS